MLVRPAWIAPLILSLGWLAVPSAEAAPQSGGGGIRRKAPKAPAASPARKDPSQLRDTLRAIVQKRSPVEWTVGVVVQDADGKVLAALSADAPLSPASNQKILVVGAALGLLGPGFQYETQLLARCQASKGEIQDLVVRGDGDPNISGRFHNNDPTAIFKDWARLLKAAGLTRITGDLVVDDSRFDAARLPAGWKASQAGRPYSAEIGALNLNDNCIDITTRPGRIGEPALVELRPATAYVSIENQCTTAAGKGEPIFERKLGTNTIQVRKAISPQRKQFSDVLTVQDPGLYFGTVLHEVLRAEGIAIGGSVVRAKAAERIGASPVVLHTHAGPLLQDLAVINKPSNNLHADVLLKALGFRTEGLGSAANGAKAIETFLKREGISSEGLHVEDGSGLAAGDRVSASTLSGVLSWIQRQSFARQYIESLPVAGTDGTLKKRFHGRKSANHVFAKTGYINGVSALSGYVERGGKMWVFSVIVNGMRKGKNRSADISGARSLQEEVAEEVFLSMPD